MTKATTIWRKDRIGIEDAETGLRAVSLPTVPGMTAKQRDAVFAFERPILGTSRALIRICKRAEGTPLPVPYKVSKTGIPKALAAFYEGKWVEIAEFAEDEV